MIWGKGWKSREGWWFAWHPVRLAKSGRWLWLQKVYRVPDLWGIDVIYKYYMSE